MNRSLLLVVALLIGGCGGGGSGTNSSSESSNIIASSSTLSGSVSSAMSSSQSSVNREFGLHKFNSVAPGVVYSSRLEAINSLGYTVVGDIWIVNQAEELLNGILVTPRVIRFMECSNDCMGSNSLFPRVAWNFTYYIETTTGNLISFKQYKQSSHSSEEVVLDCRSVSPYQMPSVIKSGDFGVTPGFNCGATTIDENSWSATGKGNDHLVLSIKYKGYGGTRSYQINEIEVFEILYTLDGEGNIVSLSAGGLSSKTVN